jgi:hypothetical protein
VEHSIILLVEVVDLEIVHLLLMVLLVAVEMQVLLVLVLQEMV